LDLATYLPLKNSDLPNISGFGTYKIEHYGAAFLEMVQDYCIEHQIDTRMELKHPQRKKQSKVIKERETETKKLSFDQYKKGFSIESIAEERGLSTTTIENHLSYYIGKGQLSLDEFVKETHQALIKKAAEKHGRLSLRKLKDNLPDVISYGAIRMVLNSMTLDE
jgi:ATP-dependent DNA helicase RecQ